MVNRDTGEIADMLVGTGQLVEQCRLAGILVADQSECQQRSIRQRMFFAGIMISAAFAETGMFAADTDIRFRFDDVGFICPAD